jgi:hypothetical protein
MTGTLAELSTHYKQDYNLVYHNLHRLSWSIEQALGLEKPPSDKKVNGALPNVRANPE